MLLSDGHVRSSFGSVIVDMAHAYDHVVSIHPDRNMCMSKMTLRHLPYDCQESDRRDGDMEMINPEGTV